MAEATQMITGIRAYFWAPLFAALILGLLFWTSYRTMARIFKWLTLVLFAYIITAFLARPDWMAVMRATFVPHVEFSKQYMAVLVGILGTTISPYLFLAGCSGGGRRPRPWEDHRGQEAGSHE